MQRPLAFLAARKAAILSSQCSFPYPFSTAAVDPGGGPSKPVTPAELEGVETLAVNFFDSLER